MTVIMGLLIAILAGAEPIIAAPGDLTPSLQGGMAGAIRMAGYTCDRVSYNRYV